MPYTASTVPKHVPKAKAAQWAAIFNSALKEHDEETAFKMANAILKAVEKDYISSVYSIDSRQIPQYEAGYDPVGMSGGKGCANCNWFVPQDSGCLLVQGDIMPTGLSDFWLAKPEHHQEPVPVVIVPQNEDKSLLGKVKSMVGLQHSERAPFMLFKSADELRFLCTPTNCFMDREYDIITSQAHKDFVAYCNENKQYPELWLWHVKGTKCGSIDWLEYDDEGFICASGVIDKNWTDVVLKACEDGNLGMSHGFYVLPGGVDNDGYITKYLSFEYSLLPVKNASNVWTAFNVQKGLDEMALSADSKNWLSKLGITNDQLTEFEATNKETAEKLRAGGIKNKEIPDGATTQEGAASTTQGSGSAAPSSDGSQSPVQFASSEDVQQGFKAIADMFNEINKNMTAMAGRIEEVSVEVKKSLDDRVDDVYKSKVASQPGGFVATKDDGNTTTQEQDNNIKIPKGPDGKPISFLDQVLDNGMVVAGIPMNGGSN